MIPRLRAHCPPNHFVLFPLELDNQFYYTIVQLSEKTGYHPVYLRRLILEGKIPAIKVQIAEEEPEFYWATTEAAILEYETNKDARGRPKNSSRA